MSHNYDLKERIDELESLEGEGTELVTVTIPSDKSLDSIRERIAQEYAGAENIKSDQTRDRVQRALNRIQRILRRYAETPDDGLVVYAGVINGELVSEVFDDLPTPVPESTYRCSDQFVLTPLLDAVSPSETFGLIVIERGEAAIGRLVGERVSTVQTFESQVMGKSRAGGQSAARFERERERQAHEFFQKVGEIANTTLIDDENSVTGVVIGGTLATAKQFASGDYLDHRLKDRIIGIYSVEYANVQGLHELVEKAEDRLLDAEAKKAREHLDEFYSRLREGDQVVYGSKEVEKAIDYGAVDMALVASSVPRVQREELERDVVQQGGDVYVISTDSEKGHRFARNFGGVGALLRFALG